MLRIGDICGYYTQINNRPSSGKEHGACKVNSGYVGL